jgi:hypothetical protein
MRVPAGLASEPGFDEAGRPIPKRKASLPIPRKYLARGIFLCDHPDYVIAADKERYLHVRDRLLASVQVFGFDVRN